jgi:hypothetical protein
MDIGRVLIAIGLAGLAGTAIYHLRTHHKPSWTSEVPMENLIRSCNKLNGDFIIEPNMTKKHVRFICEVKD